MKTILKKLFNASAPFYLGFSLFTFANLRFTDWEFYAIIIPFFILAKATKFNQDE